MTPIQPCIPGRRSRNEPVRYDKRRYRRRIAIMFGRLKDWRRVATRYDRCPAVFFAAFALTATVIFWLRPMSPDHSIESGLL
jgi:transposase